MFTGLVEEVGALLEKRLQSGGGASLRIRALKTLEGIALGDSIAVNGVCLTATEWDHAGHWVWFDAVAETLRLTTLASLSVGSSVNLERALAVGDRLGGHYVTGHIDGTGTLESTQASGNGTVYKFSAPTALTRLIAQKGSITVDGISLTVVDATNSGFSVWIVPHTQKVTNLGQLKPGAKVNLETDILAKYVHRAMQAGTDVSRYQQLKEAGFNA